MLEKGLCGKNRNKAISGDNKEWCVEFLMFLKHNTEWNSMCYGSMLTIGEHLESLEKNAWRHSHAKFFGGKENCHLKCNGIPCRCVKTKKKKAKKTFDLHLINMEPSNVCSPRKLKFETD